MKIRLILQRLRRFSVNRVKKTRLGCSIVLHIKAYIYLCVVNKLVSNVTAAILDSLRAEVRVSIPASVGTVCVACSRRGMLHSGCCDNSN